LVSGLEEELAKAAGQPLTSPHPAMLGGAMSRKKARDAHPPSYRAATQGQRMRRTVLAPSWQVALGGDQWYNTATGMKKEPTSKQSSQERARRLLNQGADLLSKGKAQEAIPHLERAFQLDAESVPTLINLGGAYIMTGQHHRAVPILEAARDAEPHNAMVWINLGAAYLGNPVLATREQQELAIVTFEKALEFNPAAPSVHYNLGLIFVERGDADLAEAAFRQAIKVNPFDRDARFWLGKLQNVEDREEEDG
jgi:tetratricopeptide (TPR) repeat protein